MENCKEQHHLHHDLRFIAGIFSRFLRGSNMVNFPFENHHEMLFIMVIYFDQNRQKIDQIILRLGLPVTCDDTSLRVQYSTVSESVDSMNEYVNTSTCIVARVLLVLVLRIEDGFLTSDFHREV